MDVLLKGSTASLDKTSKSWSLNFCLSPKIFEGRDDHVEATSFEQTTLSSSFDPAAYATGTGEPIRLPSSTVFRSIGYKSEALDGFSDIGIPFDSRRGVIQNDSDGRVQQEIRTPDGAIALRHFPGLYCAGWVKRGPTGVIASTMTDAFTTGDAIVQDWTSRVPFLRQGDGDAAASGWEAVKSELDMTKARTIQWSQWQKIDRAERERGRAVGKEREKFISTLDMLSASD
jgi:adrenodoxin-NADP+ reductase